MKNRDVVASIKNKLGPFWTLVDLLLIDDELLPEDVDKYSELIQDTAEKCRDNQDILIQELNKIK